MKDNELLFDRKSHVLYAGATIYQKVSVTYEI